MPASNVDSAVTPRDFPLELADFLRANAIEVEANGELFDDRRRVKTAAELDGIRRAQRASERAMAAIRERLRGGGPVTCEDLQTDAMRVFSEEGVLVDDVVRGFRRRADHGRARARPRPDRRARADRRRPVPAGSRLRAATRT